MKNECKRVGKVKLMLLIQITKQTAASAILTKVFTKNV